MNIYIHYNGHDFFAPKGEDDVWTNYRNPDSAKMFLVCADSWERNGWTPVRLDTSNIKGFEFSGACVPLLEHWPLPMWNTWFMLRELAPCMFCTIDTINNGLGVENPIISHDYLAHDHCVSYSSNFTMHAFYCGQDFPSLVIDTIYRADRGELPLPQTMHVSDEQIIRQHLSEKFYFIPRMKFSRINKDDNSMLTIYPRSILARALYSISVLR